VLTRTARGWSVRTPEGAEAATGLLEAMSLADVVAADLGAPGPDRQTRRAARGAGPAAGAEGRTGDGAPDAAVDPREAEVAALRRTVAQLEHALATRVGTERAIGVLAERHGTSPRAAFEALRSEARSHGRSVHDLAADVLATLQDADRPPCPEAGEAGPSPLHGQRSGRRVERVRSRRASAEGRS
jgi:hypothetical protein